MNQEKKPLLRIHEYMTKSTWLHAEDALHFTRDDTLARIPKIRLFAGLYRRGDGANAQLAHWLDAADARVIFSDLSWGKPVEFVDYKGSNGPEPESRVLRINCKGDKVYFQLTSGPGKPTATGAIMPNGPSTEKVNVGMSTNEARKMAYAVLEHMVAFAASQLVAVSNELLAQSATKKPSTLTLIEAEDLSADLFGSGKGKSKLTFAGKTHRGRQVTSTGLELAKPVKVDGQICYGNGEPLDNEVDGYMFRSYQDGNRGEAPRSREAMTGWIYR